VDVARLSSYRHDGLTFDVLDEGPVDGDPVVLLHGFPERATCWRLVAPLLHAAGLRTIAPDQRGYSRGARPRGRRSYATGRMVGDAIALIERIGQPVHLVGHDWGAAVGWAVAAFRPDVVRSWTAFSVPHTAAYAKALRGPQLRRSWYMAAFMVPSLPELSARPGGPMERMLGRSGMTADDLARFQREVVADGALPGALGWYRGLPFSMSSRVGAVTVPTTMVWSTRDGAIDRQGVVDTEQFCSGPYEYVELSGVTHWIPTQAPDAAAKAILDRIGSVA